jgi:transposase InsO family protein
MDWLKEAAMPWQEVSIMEQRREFVRLFKQEGVNRRELCLRFGIHASTGYKWLSRGEADLGDRSRRPHSSPLKTNASIEARILKVREDHPAWGARKIAAILKREGFTCPAVSTVHEILVRKGCIEVPPQKQRASLRFEKEAPNLLWQMDFKGKVGLTSGIACHPLTIVDDHSRYALGIEACANEQGTTVQSRLVRVFERYGLPHAFFVDNGPPWGESLAGRWTRFTVWLLKLGVDVLHSRPYHPQSRGKNERFHRTLYDEVFALKRFSDLADVQCAFDRWRAVYNLDRPHAALNHDVPASRYVPSRRAMPASLPEVEYDEGETVRTVPETKDYISFKGRLFKVPQAFRGERLAIRPLSADARFGIYFAAHLVQTIDLTTSNSVGHVSEQVSAISPG